MAKAAEDYLPALVRDPRIEAAAAECDGLLIGIGGETVRVSPDAAHGRTVLWARLGRLAPGDTAGGAVAARRWNAAHYDRDGLAMGLYVEGNALILGRSIDGEALDDAELIDAAVGLRAALGPARALLDGTLEETRRDRRRRPPTPGDAPLIRA